MPEICSNYGLVFPENLKLVCGRHKDTLMRYSKKAQSNTPSNCNQNFTLLMSEWITDSSRNSTTPATNNTSMGMCIFDALFEFTSLRSCFVWRQMIFMTGWG